MGLITTELIARPAIWGGRALSAYFGKPLPDGTGQAWAFSAQKGASSVLGGDYAGWELDALWREKPELFGSARAAFPFIISLVAPEMPLSVQVHPGDADARRAGYASGKNEAWYFLDAPAQAKIVYGCRARTRDDLRDAMRRDAWDETLCDLPVRAGNFVYLPAGVIHALCAGAVVYEVQQATDVTYRLFDYHRKDSLGRERPLQTEEALACARVDIDAADAKSTGATTSLGGATETVLIQNDSFTVRRIALSGVGERSYPGYMLMTVASGNGEINGCAVCKGDSFLLPVNQSLRYRGDMLLLSTSEG